MIATGFAPLTDHTRKCLNVNSKSRFAPEIHLSLHAKLESLQLLDSQILFRATF